MAASRNDNTTSQEEASARLKKTRKALQATHSFLSLVLPEFQIAVTVAVPKGGRQKLSDTNWSKQLYKLAEKHELMNFTALVVVGGDLSVNTIYATVSSWVVYRGQRYPLVLADQNGLKIAVHNFLHSVCDVLYLIRGYRFLDRFITLVADGDHAVRSIMRPLPVDRWPDLPRS